MALHWQPVGPESAETYWKRRAAVALAVLVPLVLLLSLLSRLGGDDEVVGDDGDDHTFAGGLGGPQPDSQHRPECQP